MKKYFLCAIVMATTMSSMAQDAYDAAILATEDLNGTARYVGMGGALDALGADISTISSNPAGIGLFRHSDIRLSFGLLSQADSKKTGGVNPTNMSFDQIGFVWANETGYGNFINVGFNYHKSRNFTQILSAANSFAPSQREDDNGTLKKLVGSGQNLQTAVKGMRGLFSADNEDADRVNYYVSQVDYMYNQLLNVEDDKGKTMFYPLTASAFNFDKGTKGYIGVYDFNLSGNVHDRVYWGFTIGLHDVHYESYTTYGETLESGQSFRVKGTEVKPERAGLIDERSIKGQGVDVKAGLIVRPIEDSPFRFGVSVASPTWYKLTTNNNTTVYVDERRNLGNTYDFKYNTPWVLGASLGHTIENYLALGLGYEYTMFNTADMRYLTYGSSTDASRSDKEMNDEIGNSLRGSHALKVGVELRPDPSLAVRLGYNFVSSPYKSNSEAWRNQKAYSPGVYYASSTDYVNWKATHRVTAGIGTKIGKFGLDLAYQCNLTKGDMFPFADGEYYEDKNIVIENHTPATPVNFTRHQVLFSLGYTF